jgi:hypothetical protein
MQAIKCFGFTGITTDLEGLQLKANAWPVTASACCKRCQQRRQRPFCYGRILYWRCCTQAASIPEDLTDNELVLNATSFNKKSYNRPTQQINGLQEI